MDAIVAISAERDQILVCVVTQQASRANVVDLKTIGTAAVLASPARRGWKPFVGLSPFAARIPFSADGELGNKVETIVPERRWRVAEVR
jgi:hypothetical protein